MNQIELMVLLYLLLISVYGFLVFALDKHRAIKGLYRVPEKILFLIAFLGGGLGCWLGMKIFNHKTRVLRFRILLPLAACLPLFLIYGILVDWSIIN